MHIESPAFQHNAEIPERFTCEGLDISPSLSLRVDAAGAKALALIVDDPDAPGGSWTHWIVYNLPASTSELPEAVAAARLPPGTRFGRNSWQRTGWNGPCPPGGKHRYVFTLYALDDFLTELGLPNKGELLRAMKGHVVGEASFVGTYERKRPARQAIHPERI